MSTTTNRMTRRDWIEAAYAALASGGERGITINGLAARLGVTKGSFYWHFPDRATLVQAVLDRWAYVRTDELMALRLTDSSVADAAERLRRIHALGPEVAPIDRAMRLWAQHEPRVAEAVRHADASIVSHVAGCLVDLGFAAEEAEFRAVTMLRAWVGGYFVASTANSGPDPYQRSLSFFLGDHRGGSGLTVP
jgi:AcrR family transcriptional regulator